MPTNTGRLIEKVSLGQIESHIYLSANKVEFYIEICHISPRTTHSPVRDNTSEPHTPCGVSMGCISCRSRVSGEGGIFFPIFGRVCIYPPSYKNSKNHHVDDEVVFSQRVYSFSTSPDDEIVFGRRLKYILMPPDNKIMFGRRLK